eukprot:3510_1
MISLNKHSISAKVIDRYAYIVYSFHFENTKRNGSNELHFDITIGAEAFISKFEANIDGELFIGKCKEKETAANEYVEAKEKNENAIIITQPFDNIPNVFTIKTNIDSQSKITLKITIEEYLQKQFNFNLLTIELLKSFNKYNITQNYNYLSFKIDINDHSGIYDIIIPSNNTDIIIDNTTIDDSQCHYIANGKIMNKTYINELIIKYKIKGEQNESMILFDNKTNTFCHIISDIITNSMIIPNENNIEGQQS